MKDSRKLSFFHKNGVLYNNRMNSAEQEKEIGR